MSNNIDGKGVTVSVKIYDRLLVIYPEDFRREYGPAMTQLFRDQCRDAWSQAQGRGLAILWLRVALDLGTTSLLEHLASLHRRESMCRKMLRGFDAGLRSIFGRVFAMAFLCVFGFSVCQMFWTPKVYSSTTRIEVQKDAPEIPAGEVRRPDPYFLTTQFKIIESWSILTNVIATLHLDDKLAAQAGEAHWTMDQTYANLFNKISVEQTRMTSLIEISVKNRDPKLAADIANAIVDAYRGSRWEKWKGDHYGGIIALQIKLGDEETRLRNMEANLTELERQNQPSLKLKQEIEALRRNNSELNRVIQREMAMVGSPLKSIVIVRDPARPILRPIQSMSDIFTKWMFGGTLAALVAGGAAPGSHTESGVTHSPRTTRLNYSLAARPASSVNTIVSRRRRR